MFLVVSALNGEVADVDSMLEIGLSIAIVGVTCFCITV